MCEDVPKNLVLEADNAVFCESCPKTTKEHRLFREKDLKIDCSRAVCRKVCDQISGAGLKSKDPKIKAAAVASKQLCYDSCNAIRRKP